MCSTWWRVQLLLTFWQVELSVIVVLDEEHCNRPEGDTAHKDDGVEDEFEVTGEDGLGTIAHRHLLHNLGASLHQGFIGPWGEELIDTEGQGDKDEE